MFCKWATSPPNIALMALKHTVTRRPRRAPRRPFTQQLMQLVTETELHAKQHSEHRHSLHQHGQDVRRTFQRQQEAKITRHPKRLVMGGTQQQIFPEFPELANWRHSTADTQPASSVGIGVDQTVGFLGTLLMFTADAQRTDQNVGPSAQPTPSPPARKCPGVFVEPTGQHMSYRNH